MSQQDTFDSLKTTITSTSVLTFSNISVLFWIKTDSLDFTTGTMLFQESKADSK